MIGFTFLSLSCVLLPKSTVNKIAGMKDWSEFGSGQVVVKVLKTEAFKSYGNACKITFEAKNNTNSSFQMLVLAFKVIGKDRSQALTGFNLEELKMGGSQIKEVILTNNIECGLVDHLEFDQVSISNVREGMIPVSVFNCEKALLFPEDGAISIRKK